MYNKYDKRYIYLSRLGLRLGLNFKVIQVFQEFPNIEINIKIPNKANFYIYFQIIKS